MKKVSFLLVALIAVCQMWGQLTTFDYATGVGQAVLSDKYDVYVKMGTNAEVKLEVLMSNAIHAGDWMTAELQGRTFSFVHVDYNTNGPGLTFRVVKKYGINASAVNVSPKSYNLHPNMTSGKEATFTLDANNKYMSVDFVCSDNRTATKSWIKHMLCIYIDPPETDKPSQTGSGVVTYSNTVGSTTLQNADIIFFPKGYHNLRNYNNGGVINDGILTIQDGQKVYIQGGAFVDGLIQRAAYGNSNQKIYGRGVLSGRKFPWYNTPGYTGPSYQQIVLLGANNAQVSGVTIMESPSHGIVANKCDVTNLKMIGWHSNNDCVRVGSGSEIKNSFLRAVDDHFYNFNIWVHHCVLWAGHNGAILTYGWGGDIRADGTKAPTYNSGSSLLEEIDIIHPEWMGLGNNQGIVASQTGLDYKPYGYGGDPTTVLRNIRIEGSIPGLLNLKPRSENDAVVIAYQVPAANVGFLGDLQLENISVEGQFLKGRIKGALDAASDVNNVTYYTKDINFKNVTIGGVEVTNTNKGQFFDIESATTQNITFSTSVASQVIPGLIEAESFASQSGVNTENCSEGGLNVGWIDNGDWMDYLVNVAEAGAYSVDIRVASASAGGSFDIKKGTAVLASVNVPVTGGWQTWTSVNTTVNLSAGEQTIRVQATSSGWNLNWFDFNLVPASQEYLYIDHKSSTNRLTVSGTDIATKAATWTGDWVQWGPVNTNNGYFYLVHKATGKKLNSPDGAAVEITDASITANSAQWRWVDAGSGWYRLENRAYTRWLHVRPDGITNIIIGPTTWTGDNTKWKYSVVPKSAIQSDDDNGALSGSITLYPNPAHDILTVAGANDGYVQIFTLEGRELYSQNIEGEKTELDIQSFQSGIYLVRVITDNQQITKRIIIQ